MKSILTTVLLFLSSITAFGQSSDQQAQIVQTLDAFEQAIIDNNEEAASELITEEVRIVEGSAIETKEEYLSHHFHSDGKFLREMERSNEDQTIFVEDNIAWATTKTHVRGTYNDQQLNLSSMELAVLKKVNGQWKITALHWSSSPKKN